MRIQSICAALALGVVGAAAQAQSHYVAMTLQVPTQFTSGCYVVALNKSGTSTGNCSSGAAQVPVQWDAEGNQTLLPIPAKQLLAWATGINNAGQISGYYYDKPHNNYHAVRWDSGQFTVIDGTSNQSEALGINDSGDLVGEVNNVATIWKNGRQAASLPPPPYEGEPFDFSMARAINERGEVAGEASYDGSSFYASVLWQHRQGSVLSANFESADTAVALNAGGTAVGNVTSQVNSDFKTQAMAWTPSGDIALPALPGNDSTTAAGINRSGVVVGQSYTSDAGNSKAVRWVEGQVTDLSAITTWPLPDVVNSGASAINDRGWIAAGYSTSDSKGGPVILKPSRGGMGTTQ